MKSSNGCSRDTLVSLVIDAVAAVAPQARSIAAETSLVGSDAVLDSVGFVTFLVSLEERLDNAVDLAASFMQHEDVDADAGPFRTVGSLADHLSQLLGSQEGREDERAEVPGRHTSIDKGLHQARSGWFGAFGRSL